MYSEGEETLTMVITLEGPVRYVTISAGDTEHDLQISIHDERGGAKGLGRRGLQGVQRITK